MFRKLLERLTLAPVKISLQHQQVTPRPAADIIKRRHQQAIASLIAELEENMKVKKPEYLQ